MRFAADAIIVQTNQKLASSRNMKARQGDAPRPVLHKCKRYLSVSVMTPCLKKMASTLCIWLKHETQKRWSVSNAARGKTPCPQRLFRKLDMKLYSLAVKVLYVLYNTTLPPQDLGLANRNIQYYQLTRAAAKPGNHHNIQELLHSMHLPQYPK